MLTRACFHRTTSRLLNNPSATIISSFSSLSSSTPERRVGAVFDIDGVLIRGSDPLPHAKESLQKLHDAKIPFMLLTNGGGDTEAAKVAYLREKLELPFLSQDQVCLSHTPLKPVCAELKDEKTLILGSRDSLGVAKSYGLNKAYTIGIHTYIYITRERERER